MTDIFFTDKQYVANTYARFPVCIKEGHGSLLYDEAGKEHIDLGTGIAVNTFGASDPEWVAAITEQAGKLAHISNLYYTEPCAKLAEALCERTGMSRVFFANSGAEANECAIKAARKYSQDKKGKEYYNIITLKNSFHGRTVTTLAATGQDVFHADFTPLTEGFLYGEANNIDSIKALVADNKCAAVMLECVQGEGGVLPMTSEFMLELETLCHENDLLLVIDEVQTGNGRCGSLYAFQTYGITPDIVSTAKGLAGGLPIGATMMFDRTENVLTKSSHGSTFGGNPVSCAAAVSIIERIDDCLLKEVREKSQYIINELSGAEGIKSVSGLGLMLGIETKKDAGEVIAYCMKNGVLPIKAKNKVRLLPALNIPMDALCKAVSVIKEAAKGE